GRLQVLGNLLGVPIVPNPCDGNGGGSGGSGTGGTFGTAGTFSTGGKASSGGFETGGSASIPPPLPEPSHDPAPGVVIDLPSADTPVAELQEEDQEIREDYGDVTISGKSAQATH